MIAFLKKLLGTPEEAEQTELAILQPEKLKPAKDPMDWKKCELSTHWDTDQYCDNCKLSTSHRERMADICSTCGHFDKWLHIRRRAFRSIFDGHKWVWQYKYGNAENQYTLTTTKLHQ